MRRATFGLPVLLLSVSCENSCWMDDYSFAWHGEHVTVYGYDLAEADACGGSFAELDGHTGMIMEALGVHESTSYTYRWLSDDFWSQWDGICPATAIACVSEGEVVSRSLPDMHEVVHMVNRSAGGCPNVLDEGLAMYYDGPGPLWYLYPSSDLGILPLLTAKKIPTTPDAYLRAGHFASFLVETYGPEAVMQLCQAIPRQSTISQWDAAAQRIFGVSLEQVLADYEAYPVCSYPQFRARLWGCSGTPDFTFSADKTKFVADTGCSDRKATNGVWSTRGDAVLLRRVYFPKDTWIEVSAYSTGESGLGATYLSQECVPCSQDPQVFAELDDVDVQFYRAGLHEVSVFFDERDSIRLTMTALP